MTVSWKSNWEETRQHFLDWWNREGLVLAPGVAPESSNFHEGVPHPGEAPDIEYFYTHPEWRAKWNYYNLSRQGFPTDILPLSNPNVGPGSLALYVGGQARLADDTVWFEPMIDPDDPEGHPPLKFDPACYWWRITEATLQACAALGKGKYLVGCPDLVENIDIVAALREPQRLLMDMIERPDWVLEKVWEVNEAFFAVYDRIYEIIKLADGSSCFKAFNLWGPGKTAKVQCDTAAMFSPRMFSKFVIPALTAQCECLDHSMFHLDGPDCIRHLDLLLEIEPLDAVEWTPGPQVPSGGDPEWYPMYRKILEAGKSVQAIEIKLHEVEPLLDAVGGKGMYIMPECEHESDYETLLKIAEPFR